jgi:hypothetical protein
VNYRANLWSLRTSYTSLKEELTMQLPLKDRRKKKQYQPPAETTTELLLKYQHQDWMLEE